MSHIILNGQSISYTIRLSKRVRHLRIEISPIRGLVVILPPGYRISDVPGVLRQRARWILTHLGRLNRAAPDVPRLSIGLEDGQKLPFLGEKMTLRLVPVPNFRSNVAGEVQDGEMRLFLPLSHTAWRDTVQRLLLVEELYRAEARRYFTQRSQHWAKRMGITVHRITIKEQKTRWGSCSSRGNLNFNWRLMLAPRLVVEYVVVHELAHRLHMNHSPAFWATVRYYLPDFRSHRQWLKEYGHQLWQHASGPMAGSSVAGTN